MLIEVRCDACSKLLCRVSKDFYGVVELKCRHCKKSAIVSVAMILKQMADNPAILRTLRAPA
jgi:phage FluMu protein Com